MHVGYSLEKLASGSDLTRLEARQVMGELLSGTVPDGEIVALLSALRDRSETVDVLVGFAEVMRARAAEALTLAGLDIDKLARDGPLLDTCGTGGDGHGTFNVSTATALVVAGAGVRVAKHGNRSISSRCGSADVLEALGVTVEIAPEQIGECLEAAGCVFLYAPQHHSATRHVMNARRALKGKTVFNLLGPLTNPLRPTCQLAGIYHHSKAGLMARAFSHLGTDRAMVVSGWDGMDEISLTGLTHAAEVTGHEVTSRQLSPEDFGMTTAPPGAIEGGDARENAAILRAVLEGVPGPYLDATLVNAAAALAVASRASTLPEGVEMARESIRSGAAERTLMRLAEFTTRRGPASRTAT